MRTSTRAWYITWSQALIHFSTASFLHSISSLGRGRRPSISLNPLQGGEGVRVNVQVRFPRGPILYIYTGECSCLFSVMVAPSTVVEGE